MTHFVSDILDTVFKPGAAVFALAIGLAIVSFDTDSTHKSVTSGGMLNLTCDGALKTICGSR